jgi:hypothetical protein
MAFLSAMGKRNAHFMRGQYSRSCEQCGKDFVSGQREGKFCCNACKSKWRRANGLDDIQLACARCGAAFLTSKFKPSKHCSRECARREWAATAAGQEHMQRIQSLGSEARRKG